VIDYGVAARAAAFPWILSAVCLVFLLHPAPWNDPAARKESLLAGRFTAPTSAGILLPMLAAAGLSATWYFRKVRILAIFDDLDTVLFMIPLKMLVVGFCWQLTVIAGGLEDFYKAGKPLDEVVAIHIEVLLAAFVMGCILVRPAGADRHSDDARGGR